MVVGLPENDRSGLLNSERVPCSGTLMVSEHYTLVSQGYCIDS